MKKVFALLMLASLTLLVACQPTNDQPPAENTAPVLHGVVDVPEHVKGTPFDPMEGVSAIDAEDGDLTEDIVVTGEVDVNADGAYTLTYTVEDSKGLSATKNRVVTVYTPNSVPVITVPKGSVVIQLGETFDPMAGVTAKDEEDGALTNITVSGTVKNDVVGRNQVVYSAKDSDGEFGYATVNVLVVEDKSALFNGKLNLKFAPADVKHTFFAAAEKYLLDNMVGGIPFYVANSFSLLADRVTLPVAEYIPSYGWGTRLATVTKDDSEVLGVEGEFGEAGKYTYRAWENQDYTTLNFWIYDDSVSATYLDFIEGGFYRVTLNDAKNGWEFAPSLADGAPTPKNPVEVNGKVTAKTWEVSLLEGLEWAFHSDINTTGFDKVLDANDFIWTYREALNKNLFRAISGGGDFASEIVGAEDYSKLAADVYAEGKTPTQAQLDALDVAWETVGLKKLDDLTLSFTFKNAKAEFDAYYVLGWPAMNEDLYKKHGNQYGTGPLTVASSGEYVMTYHEAGKITKYVKNEKYPHHAESQWTGWDIYIYQSAEVAFQAFLDGKLESSGVPNARIEEFISDPRLLQTPDATTWRLNINGLRTPEAQRAEFPGSTYNPKPILGYADFRKALFYILDRQDLQQNWVPSSGMGISYFSSLYFVDPESGIPYRSTPQGIAVEEAYGVDSWGYNEGLALSYLRSAVTQAIADGYYAKGTAANPTEIKIDLRFMNLTTSEATAKRADFVKESFENLVDDQNHVKIVIDVKDTPFPGIYYDYMMTGDFDIAIGGISGSTLDASSFLDVFASDDRGGFTINWGFDSSLPEIPVTWDHDNDSETPDITKFFSYNAIVSALTGTTYIEDGGDVPPVLAEGEYDTWTEVKGAFEDFFDVNEYPEIPGEGFEVIKDESGFGGIWIVLPEGTTFAELKVLFEGKGFTYYTTEDYEDDWGPEFATDSNVAVIYGPDWFDTDDDVVNGLVDKYGLEVPVDSEGNALVAILLY